MKTNQRLAIVATSPLQIMLAHKILKIYNPSYIRCYLITYEGDNRYEKCYKLASYYGYDTQKININDYSYINGTIKHGISSFFCNDGFDIVILGIFNHYLLISFSIKLLKNGGALIFTDDGTATLYLNDDQYMNSFRKSYIFKGLTMLMALRKIKHQLFYTIFDDLKKSHYEFKKLNIEAKNNGKYPKGVFFLGTFMESYISSFIPEMTEDEFNKLIAKSVKYVNDNYSYDEVMYTPHGRENLLNSKFICKKWNLNYLPSQISVEFDYPKLGYYPKVIVGFSSTALVTLKKMYPLSVVIDFRPYNIEYKLPYTMKELNNYEDTVGISRVYIKI